jgi:thiamine-monophosphate kinase
LNVGPSTDLPAKPPSEGALRVRNLGEFGLIARLQAHLDARLAASPSGRPALALGIGDDAAVWSPLGQARQVVTTDALVQDVHFKLSTTSWRDLGWKSLAVNVSDLAAMGAAPRYALVTLGLPGDTSLSDVLELYEGMIDLAGRFELLIIGGDVVASPALLLSVTALGEATGDLLRRDAGRPGDLLAVTGTLGASAGGLRLLEAGRRPGQGSSRLFEAHLRPWPRVAEGAALVRAGLRCGMDVSDGLVGDTTHICEQSSLGALIEVDRVPVDPALRAEFGAEALQMAIAGGEDYELLCAGPAAAIERARTELSGLGTAMTVIGSLTDPPTEGPLVRLLDAGGRPVATERDSWDHFRA